MNFIDIFVLVPALWFTYKGFRKGLIFELSSIVALFLGTWVAINFSNKVGEWLNIGGNYAEIISFAITFALIIAAVYIISKAAEKIVEITISDMANKVFGAIFGALKILLIASIFFKFLNSYDPHGLIIKNSTKEESISYRFVEPIAEKTLPAFRSAMDRLGRQNLYQENETETEIETNEADI